MSKHLKTSEENLLSHVGNMKNAVGDSLDVKKLGSLGIFSDAPITNKSSVLDALATLLDGRMQYKGRYKLKFFKVEHGARPLPKTTLCPGLR